MSKSFGAQLPMMGALTMGARLLRMGVLMVGTRTLDAMISGARALGALSLGALI